MLSRLAAALAAHLIAACSSTTTNVDLKDNGVLIPSARVAVDFGERPGPPSHLHTSHAVELGVSGGSGGDDGSIAAG